MWAQIIPTSFFFKFHENLRTDIEFHWFPRGTAEAARSRPQPVSHSLRTPEEPALHRTAGPSFLKDSRGTGAAPHGQPHIPPGLKRNWRCTARHRLHPLRIPQERLKSPGLQHSLLRESLGLGSDQTWQVPSEAQGDTRTVAQCSAHTRSPMEQLGKQSSTWRHNMV
jgi:hypothetical protein